MTNEVHCCPICAVPFQPGDICADDIELGTCHAACLEGSPVVDLETGHELSGGQMDTYPYGDFLPATPAPETLSRVAPQLSQKQIKQTGHQNGCDCKLYDKPELGRRTYARHQVGDYVPDQIHIAHPLADSHASDTAEKGGRKQEGTSLPAPETREEGLQNKCAATMKKEEAL
jgi:hypothetical protein